MKENIILPDYNHCILNLMNSILKSYGVETAYDGLPVLDEKLKNHYKNVVFIILDGLGKHVLEKLSPNGFLSNHIVDTITSVYPSTTTAALTTYYSGRPPIETAWVAMSQYFKEYGRAMEMLREIDTYTRETVHSPRDFDAFDLVGYTPIYEQIETASPDVKAYEINPGFCKARSKRNINADNISLLCDSIYSICSNQDRNFILAYSENPDVILHKHGCASKEAKEFVLDAEKKIESLSSKLNKEETLVIIAADHGHKDIEKTYSMLDMPDILECCILPPSLESRVVSFWIKEDKKQTFEKLFNEKFKGEYLLYTKEEFLKNHFLGFGKQHPKIDDFVGNYIALSIGSSAIKLDTYLSKSLGKDKKSTHCGLSPDEMEVALMIL